MLWLTYMSFTETKFGKSFSRGMTESNCLHKREIAGPRNALDVKAADRRFLRVSPCIAHVRPRQNASGSKNESMIGSTSWFSNIGFVVLLEGLGSISLVCGWFGSAPRIEPVTAAWTWPTSPEALTGIGRRLDLSGMQYCVRCDSFGLDGTIGPAQSLGAQIQTRRSCARTVADVDVEIGTENIILRTQKMTFISHSTKGAHIWP